MKYLKSVGKFLGKGLIAALLFTLAVWAANTTLTGVALINSTIDSTIIGGTTPAAGIFSTIQGTSLTTGDCLQAGVFQSIVNFSSRCASPVFSVTTNNLSGNVIMSGSVLTTIDTQSVTMPSTGCPCRVLITYTYFYETGTASSGNSVNLYVTDGTVNLAYSQQGLVANNVHGGLSASDISPDYANGATVVFTTKAESDVSSSMTIDLSAVVLGGAFNSNIKFTIVPSL